MPRREPSLAAMLVAFDLARYCGEAMAFAPIGLEILTELSSRVTPRLAIDARP